MYNNIEVQITKNMCNSSKEPCTFLPIYNNIVMMRCAGQGPLYGPYLWYPFTHKIVLSKPSFTFTSIYQNKILFLSISLKGDNMNVHIVHYPLLDLNCSQKVCVENTLFGDGMHLRVQVQVTQYLHISSCITYFSQ